MTVIYKIGLALDSTSYYNRQVIVTSSGAGPLPLESGLVAWTVPILTPCPLPPPPQMAKKRSSVTMCSPVFIMAVYTTTRVRMCLYHPATRMWLYPKPGVLDTATRLMTAQSKGCTLQPCFLVNTSRTLSIAWRNKAVSLLTKRGYLMASCSISSILIHTYTHTHTHTHTWHTTAHDPVSQPMHLNIYMHSIFFYISFTVTNLGHNYPK